jgi:type 1 fimbriae regulatory protein FimB/type 1 fimbriae regulatory protein FimE
MLENSSPSSAPVLRFPKPPGVQSSHLPPIRRPNIDSRPREHLTPAEVEKLTAAAGKLGRHGHRDATMVMMAYRHGLRVSELVSLRWVQVDLKDALLHVRRRKNGIASTHPLYGPELRALRKLVRDCGRSPSGTSYVFLSERKSPLSEAAFRKLVARAGRAAELANDGHDTRAIQHYLGHRNIQHTVVYTQLAAGRFNEFWDD